MRKILLLGLFILPSLAGATVAQHLIEGLLTGGGKLKPERYWFGILRLSGGYGQSQIYDMKPVDQVKEFKGTQGHWAEVDFGAILSMHFGFANLKDKEASVDINGGGFKNAQLSFDKYQYGLKLILPIMYLNPWVGGGVMAGHLEIRETSGTGGKEHSRFTGRYWHAGFDVLFSPYIGLRLAYQNDTVDTRKFDLLGNTPMHFEQHLGQAGLLIYF